jgi:hypothetical protein
VDEISPEILSEFQTLCDKAAEYRVLCHGRNGQRPQELPRTEDGRSIPMLYSHQLLLISDLVNRHPELRGEWRDWKRRISGVRG